MCVVMPLVPVCVALRRSRVPAGVQGFESQGACTAPKAQKGVHCSTQGTKGCALQHAAAFSCNQTTPCASPPATLAPWVWASAGVNVGQLFWHPCRSRLPPAGWCAATGMPPLPQRRLWTPPLGAGQEPAAAVTPCMQPACKLPACLHAPCNQLTPPLKPTHMLLLQALHGVRPP